jgi:DNA mismatch endonuclease (patch repair protein)
MKFDHVSAVRSRTMAAIRGKDTKPEMVVRKALHGAGLRFRLHRRELPGSPDIVFGRIKTVVFVHGCFWHHHQCAPRRWPKTRKAFWRAKILGNETRDRRTIHLLKAAGWRVEIVWECELRDGRRVGRLIRLVKRRRGAVRDL